MKTPEKKKRNTIPGRAAHRPPAVIDWSKVDDLLSIACTGEEIAAVMGLSYDTFERHCPKEKGCTFAEYIKQGIAKEYNRSLRRRMRMVALGWKDEDGQMHLPNPTMLIWLSKQQLGMKDKTETDITTDGKGINIIFQPVEKKDE